MNLAERLKELRTKKKLSQTKLSELIGLHYTMIGRYERGECRPTSDVLRKLAAVLEVSTDFLVEGSTEEAAKDHIHDRELMRQFKQVQDLDHHDKDVIKTLIDAFLAKRQIQKIVK